MKLDPQTRALIEAEQFDEIEELWLIRVGEDTEDLDFYLPILATLVRFDQSQRAELLCQLLSEAHREAGQLAAERELLRAVLQFWPHGTVACKALIENVRLAYPESPSFAALLRQFHPQDSPDPLASIDRLESWLRFDVGRAVYMERRGLGRVKEINLALDRLRVEFQNEDKLESFRPAEAERLLEPLSEEHFLYEKLEHLDVLQKLSEEDPGELLRRLFTSLERPLTTPELRAMLSGIVPQTRWTAWWKKARSDRRITVGSGTRPLCSWNDSASAADNALLQEFAAATRREKLSLARKHAERSPELATALAAGIARAANAAVTDEPSFALEAALFLNKLALAGVEVGFEPADLVSGEAAAKVVAAVQDRSARESSAELIRRAHPEWQRIYAELLQHESDTRTLSMLFDALPEGAPVRQEVVRKTLAKPAHAPRFYLWLCREVLKRDDLRPHANWQLLRRLLNTFHHDAFKSVRASLRELFDPGGLGPHLVNSLTLEHAEQLLMILTRDIGLEEHRKKIMQNIVLHRFPELDKSEDDALFVTAEALEAKRLEFEKLVREEIPHNTEEIRKAAAHGDLRENFEYKSARDRQEMLSSRAKSLHEDLRRARSLDPAAIDPSVVRVGTRVRLEPDDADAATRSITILGPWDSRPQDNVFSYLAPSVTQLLGKRPGDKIELADGVFTIADIQVWQRGS